jgi:RNA polymerase sigma factor (sigma-70 family)
LVARTQECLTGDRHAAEDLVQETYVVLVRQWRRIDGYNPDPYVRRIMNSRFVDGWRRRRGVDEIPASEVSDPPSRVGADFAGGADDRLVLRDALLALTPPQRAMLLLRFYEDLSDAERARLVVLRAAGPATLREFVSPSPRPDAETEWVSVRDPGTWGRQLRAPSDQASATPSRHAPGHQGRWGGRSSDVHQGTHLRVLVGVVGFALMTPDSDRWDVSVGDMFTGGG